MGERSQGHITLSYSMVIRRLCSRRVTPSNWPTETARAVTVDHRDGVLKRGIVRICIELRACVSQCSRKELRQNQHLRVLRKCSPMSSIRDLFDLLGLKMCLIGHSPLAWEHSWPWQMKPGHTGLVLGKGVVSPGFLRKKQAFSLGSKASVALASLRRRPGRFGSSQGSWLAGESRLGA